MADASSERQPEGDPEEGAPRAPEPCCEEVRLALAMNGGVSLAIWMGGCAVELDRARRAGGDSGGKSAYDVLADCFGRRLAIDILTGTSAGGINAALLGGTIAHDRRLTPEFLRDKWIELGDLGQILHDPAEESPTSLMNGQLFHQKLLDAFGELLEPGPAKQPGDPSPAPFLDITMTDVLGVERRFRDAWGGELVAREHRPRFRFRRREHFTKNALADAARTSASFPFAFEPWRVTGRSRILAELPAQTWGIDGGLLDNAPIRDALALIPTRPAAAVVRRYFCYVNGDPVASREEGIGPLPGLRQVGAYAVNLPRVAPLVDHLYAIRDAVERPSRTAKAQEQLLKMSLEHLEDVAAKLFTTYAERRTLDSLEEILPEPSDAKATFEQLEETGGHLPWIPVEWRPGTEERWEWGLRPAQRILHLALDLLRAAIDETTRSEGAVTASEKKDAAEKRRALLTGRIAIEAQLKQLREAHDVVTNAEATSDPSKFEEEGPLARVNAACREASSRAAHAREAIDAGVDLLRCCMRAHGELFPTATRQALFGPSPDEAEQNRCFIRRALSIEVVRRAFATETDIDSSEKLHFVQLTPQAPAPIFSPNPLHIPGPASAERKLTGVGLGHFAAFYRRSWRANDFMWGRLDAAARIVDLLLDEPSPDFGIGSTEEPETRIEERAEKLSTFIVESADEDLWLVKETLSAGGVAVEGASPERLVREAIARELRAIEPGCAGAEAATAAVDLEDESAEDGPPLALTRALFQRAVQMEILRAELPVLQRESELDRKLGSGAKPLALGAKAGGGSIGPAVRAIRKLYVKSSLPKALTGKGEAVSDLGLQTITHASFVGLGAIRTAGVPMSKFFGFARPPLLAIAGTVAAKWWVRATAAAGFWAAAMFLASRLVSEDGSTAPAFSDVWSPVSLVGFCALLGVAGFVLVPGMRARDDVSPAKNFFYAFALALTGVGLVAALALIVEDISVEQLIFAPGGEKPPEEVLWAVLALLGAVSLARFPLPKWLARFRPWLGKIRMDAHWMCAVLVAAFVLLSAYTAQTLVGAFYHGLLERDARLWQGIAALVALAGAPIAALVAVSRVRVRRRRKSAQEA